MYNPKHKSTINIDFFDKCVDWVMKGAIPIQTHAEQFYILQRSNAEKTLISWSYKGALTEEQANKSLKIGLMKRKIRLIPRKTT